MNLIGKIVLVGLLLISLMGEVRGQSIPWSFTETGNTHNILFEGVPTIDGEPLEIGDAVGVFYNVDGKEECGGYAVVSESPFDITANGAADGHTGFQPGDKMFFRIWKHSTNCIIDSVSVSFNNYEEFTDIFYTNGVSRVSSFRGISLLKEEYYSLQETNANCESDGKFVLKSDKIKLDTAKVTYFVVNHQRGDTTFSNAAFETVKLPAGEYTVTLKSHSCSYILNRTFTIQQDRDCEYPILSPDIEGNMDYYIPTTGKIKIYDRNGRLRRELQAPATFDGRDFSGNPLPMGTYLITGNGAKDILITILR